MTPMLRHCNDEMDTVTIEHKPLFNGVNIFKKFSFWVIKTIHLFFQGCIQVLDF